MFSRLVRHAHPARIDVRLERRAPEVSMALSHVCTVAPQRGKRTAWLHLLPRLSRGSVVCLGRCSEAGRGEWRASLLNGVGAVFAWRLISSRTFFLPAVLFWWGKSHVFGAVCMPFSCQEKSALVGRPECRPAHSINASCCCGGESRQHPQCWNLLCIRMNT